MEQGEESDDLGDDSDDYGPATIPRHAVSSTRAAGRQAGPGIPSLQDLEERNQLVAEEAAAERQAAVSELRHERRADRALQKERLEEIVPRAAPGSHERKVEKRQMANEVMREFKNRDHSAMDAVDDGQLMGGGDDDLREYKRMKEREQRKKTEREVRREEMDRARREEIEERRQAWRKREEGTMGKLQELARQRFG